jgi:chaperonin GroEL
MGAGDDGNVLIQEAQGDVMRMEPLDGYVIVAGLKELGQIGPAFINDKANQQVKMDKGIVFLWDGSMHDLQVPAAIQTAIEGTDFYGSPILVFAHDFSDLVLEKFAKTAKGGITIAPIKTPMSGVPNSRSMFLSDMAAYTGATVYHPGNLEQFLEDEEEGFGLFQEAKVGIFESLVIAEPDSDQLEARIGELRSIHDAALDEITKMHVRASISRLTGGIVTIWVGGASDLEVKEKKHRVEDAVEAVRSAIAEGVVPGGCGVHLVLADMMKRSPNRKQSWEIMEKALTAPFGLLMSNCGEDAEQVYSEFLKDHIENVNTLPKLIFDANNHEMVEPFKGGIIEPAKVVRVSVGNALSVASLLMTLGGIVVVPRDSQLENQLAMSKQAFNDMMASGLGG